MDDGLILNTLHKEQHNSKTTSSNVSSDTSPFSKNHLLNNLFGV